MSQGGGERRRNWERRIPSDKMLGFGAELNIIGKVESVAPIYNLPIRIVWIIGAERRPSDQTLEHDRSQTPPIAIESIPVSTKDFGGNIIWRTDGRVGHHAA